MSLLKFLPLDQFKSSGSLVWLCVDKVVEGLPFLSSEEQLFITRQFEKGISTVELISPDKTLYFVSPINVSSANDTLEKYRRAAVTLHAKLTERKTEEIKIAGGKTPEELLAFAEGLALTAYRFHKYKSSEKTFLNSIVLLSDTNLTDTVEELQNVLEAVYKTRDLVNEPLIYLTAEQLSEEIVAMGKEVGFSVEVFNKSKIQSLKMGGLLAVNAGSPNPPTFTIAEYKPNNAQNAQPIILVGKGVVYDTGGLSLKPTEHSMDMMKCDMAGAAAVAGTLYAAAKNKLPLHIIGLIPATENRPDGNAITPGDIITMHNGMTVEVLNTDAEGRLILADALSYAKKFNPELVIDLATLTGAAVRAIGKEGIVYMSTADPSTKVAIETSAYRVGERMVEFPLWDDYDLHIQSDIADLKNIGTSEAGAISAAKFMEHFVSYPWIHMDIAGGAFMISSFHYWPKGGTGIGVRLLYEFLKNKINK